MTAIEVADRESNVPILSVRDVSKRFGGLIALEKVSFDVMGGSILGVIGPNGAGKTTLFNVISGFYRPNGGAVEFEKQNITGLPTHRVASLGLVRTFQVTNLYMDMDVWSNVTISATSSVGMSLAEMVIGMRSEQRRMELVHERAEKAVLALGLDKARNTLARSLPYGHQRLLAVAIALAAGPRLLLLDEPMAGMNPHETTEMASHIRQIRELGVTLLVVEHNMRGLMAVADRIVVLNFGRKLAEGTPAEIRQNPDVITAYLGPAGGE